MPLQMASGKLLPVVHRPGRRPGAADRRPHPRGGPGLEVPRQGKDYLTALDLETGDRWRLKGELYGENFQRERFDRAAAETAGDRAQGDRGN